MSATPHPPLRARLDARADRLVVVGRGDVPIGPEARSGVPLSVWAQANAGLRLAPAVRGPPWTLELGIVVNGRRAAAVASFRLEGAERVLGPGPDGASVSVQFEGEEGGAAVTFS